jgi:serine/arginine repetitive matrix protein 2
VSSEPSQDDGLAVSQNLSANAVEDNPLDENKPIPTFQDGDQPAPARSPVITAAASAPTSGPSSHPKRFSAVNINKKFLEKNSSASASNQPSPSSVVAKPGGTVCESSIFIFYRVNLEPRTNPARPAVQPSASHSRLVTTKLTATPPYSSNSGSSWSRPSSATPPAPSSSSQSNAPPPGPLISAPQLPQAGKVIQPQPRATTSNASASGSQKDGSGNSKPAWGNLRNAAPPAQTTTTDFPTAAEVAQGNHPSSMFYRYLT